MTQTVLQQRLQQAFQPEILEIADESHLHAGHAGNRGGGHYRLLIVSSAFNGLSRLARQRAVQEVLQDLYAEKIHALSILAKTPAEYRT